MKKPLKEIAKEAVTPIIIGVIGGSIGAYISINAINKQLDSMSNDLDTLSNSLDTISNNYDFELKACYVWEDLNKKRDSISSSFGKDFKQNLKRSNYSQHHKADSLYNIQKRRIDSLFDIDFTQKINSLSDEYYSRNINFMEAMGKLDSIKQDYIKKLCSFYNRRK